MSMESEVSEILRLIKAERADTIEIKKTVEGIMAAVETGNQTLLEILAACQGDGSGELVAALNALTKQIENLVVRVDDLPRAVADEVGV